MQRGDEPEAASLLKAAAEATTGEGTPETAVITTAPTDLALRVMAFGGPALSVMIMTIVFLLGGTGLRILWILPVLPAIVWPEHVASERVQGLIAIAGFLCAILGVVVFRLASGGLKRAEARVGPANFTVEGGSE